MDIFDVAIIGAGSAGCALAGRLAARTGLRIALVEAGPDYGPRASGAWPADLVDAHRTPDSHDWGFEQARARVVGGCSTHNECALVRALPGDYDRWMTPGWSDADLAPIVDDVARAVPASVCRDEELAAWQRAFLDAALDAGFPRLADEASGASGVGPFVQNVRDGIRWNAAFAFLDSVRSRVTVISGIVADRLVLEADRARVLVGRGRHGIHEIHAERFVLCAGVYGSPTILLRSGVGPADDLAKLGIPAHIALPGVGANLHDHPGVGFDYEPTRRALRAVEQDVATGRFHESQVVLKTAPDLHVVPYQVEDESDGWSFGILAYYLSPRSRGRVRLASADPGAAPAIDLGLLNDPERHDIGALLEGVDLVHRLTRGAPLADAIERGPRRFTSRARRQRFVRDNVTDYAHSVGTCRIGPSPAHGDVVDARLRVHGLRNVFVADASMIPRIPRANINLTCFIIGARAAAFLAPEDDRRRGTP
jgi:choline dehydrogenase